jgi:hypothetical protein
MISAARGHCSAHHAACTGPLELRCPPVSVLDHAFHDRDRVLRITLFAADEPEHRLRVCRRAVALLVLATEVRLGKRPALDGLARLGLVVERPIGARLRRLKGGFPRLLTCRDLRLDQLKLRPIDQNARMNKSRGWLSRRRLRRRVRSTA